MLGDPVVVRNPELQLDWLYVEDAAALICRSLSVPKPADHVFNTSGQTATRLEFAERIAEAVPSAVLVVEHDETDAGRPGNAVVIDDSALRSQIGYGSHHSLPEGIEATVALYRRAGAAGPIHA
jgi:nucleoside-diphosphate-sugar epimerase